MFLNSFIAWIGGKKLLREEIVKRFPEKMGRYIEVCGGAAWVLFHKERHAALEVYNDANGDLVNLFRCAKYHNGELHRELGFILNSRELFEDFRAQSNIQGLTDIQKAARFSFMLKVSYGANGRSYGCVKKDVVAMTNYLLHVQKRLSSVVIEHKNYDDVIKVYDRQDALFYIDPPYYGAERYYTEGFKKEDHTRLRDILHGIKGMFLLFYNDCPEIREMYKEFSIEGISRNHNMVSRYPGEEHRYSELLIRNY